MFVNCGIDVLACETTSYISTDQTKLKLHREVGGGDEFPELGNGNVGMARASGKYGM